MNSFSSRRSAGFLAAAALAASVAACGAGAPPSLPPESPTPWTARAVTAPATPQALEDRRLGTTGYACVDCHALGGSETPLRPGPPLGGLAERKRLWSGSTESPEVAVNLCVERWLARPALDAAALGGLLAALSTLPAGGRPDTPETPETPETPAPATAPASDAAAANPADLAGLPEGDAKRGAALYDAACRHCHEGGPAGALWGRPWSRGALLMTIRGLDRPRHPGTLMPPFSARVLPDSDLADLGTALADAAGRGSGRTCLLDCSGYTARGMSPTSRGM